MLSPRFPCRRTGPRRPILSDRRGAAIVEFALVAAPFIALLLAILQTSLAYLAQEALESAVESSARSIVTGQAQLADVQGSGAGMTPAQLTERFRQAGCKGLPSFMACSRLYVDVRSTSTGMAFSPAATTIRYDSGTGKPTNLSYDLGGQGALVMVRFIYLWPMRLAPHIDLSGNGGGTTLIATSVSKSEAYQ